MEKIVYQVNETLDQTQGWCLEGGCASAHIVAVNFTLSLSTLFANVIALIVIISDRQLKTSISGMLMVNMCVAGLIYAVINSILSFCSTNHQLINLLPVCLLTIIFNNTNACVVITSIAAMAFDRLIAIQSHLRYSTLATPRRCAIFICCQWLCCSLGNSIPMLMASDLVWCVKRFAGCGYNGSQLPMILLVSLVYIPSIAIILITYARIWCILRNMDMHRRNRYGVRTTILILLAFLLCTIPIAVYISIAPIKPSETNIIIYDISTLTFHSNALLCPIIYGGTNRRFKAHLHELFVSMCHRQEEIITTSVIVEKQSHHSLNQVRGEDNSEDSDSDCEDNNNCDDGLCGKKSGSYSSAT